MKKFLIAFVLSVAIGFFLHWNTPLPLVTTLFTVASVVFSVGMSLIVSISTQNIHNLQAKRMAQTTINNLLRNYIYCFLLTTLCFATAMMFKEPNVEAFQECSFSLFKHDFSFNYPLSILLFSLYTIWYYVYNMRSIRKQNYEIERRIDEEMAED